VAVTVAPIGDRPYYPIDEFVERAVATVPDLQLGWAAGADGPPQALSRPSLRLRSVIVSSTTEISVLGGERHQVEGDVREIEQLILSAARGSILEFAWVTDAQTGELLGINPDSVVMLRAVVATD
jgi:hypothetical protein